MTPDNELDLRWYFVEARGQCGVRSSLGPQLEMLRQGTLPGKHGRKLQDTPCDLEGFVDSVDRDRRRTKAGIRANRIAARLRRIERRAERVLELHYGTDTRLGDGGVSLALACWTNTAQKAFDDARLAKVDRDSVRGKALATIRLWMLWLTMQAHRVDGAEPAAILEGVLDEARGALVRAEKAYEAMR